MGKIVPYLPMMVNPIFRSAFCKMMSTPMDLNGIIFAFIQEGCSHAKDFEMTKLIALLMLTAAVGMSAAEMETERGVADEEPPYVFTNVVVSVPALTAMEEPLRVWRHADGRVTHDRLINVQALFATNRIEKIVDSQMDTNVVLHAQAYFTMVLPQERKWVDQTKKINPSIKIVDISNDCFRLDDNPYLWTAPSNFRRLVLNAKGALMGDGKKFFPVCAASFWGERLPSRPCIVVTHRSLVYPGMDNLFGTLLAEIDEDGRTHFDYQALVDLAKRKKVNRVFAVPFSDYQRSERLAADIGAKLVVLPTDDFMETEMNLGWKSVEGWRERLAEDNLDD